MSRRTELDEARERREVSRMSERLTDEQLAEFERLAQQHEAGHEPRGMYPDCMRCKTTMETPDFVDESCVFCVSCMYAVADELARGYIAMLAELRSRRAADLRHAQESCMDCEGPLVPCDCQPNCPGGRCARKCWELSPNAEGRRKLRVLAFLLGKHRHEPYAYDGEECDEAMAVLERLVGGAP